MTISNVGSRAESSVGSVDEALGLEFLLKTMILSEEKQNQEAAKTAQMVADEEPFEKMATLLSAVLTERIKYKATLEAKIRLDEANLTHSRGENRFLLDEILKLKDLHEKSSGKLWTWLVNIPNVKL